MSAGHFGSGQFLASHFASDHFQGVTSPVPPVDTSGPSRSCGGSTWALWSPTPQYRLFRSLTRRGRPLTKRERKRRRARRAAASAAAFQRSRERGRRLVSDFDAWRASKGRGRKVHARRARARHLGAVRTVTPATIQSGMVVAQRGPSPFAYVLLGAAIVGLFWALSRRSKGRRNRRRGRYGRRG